MVDRIAGHLNVVRRLSNKGLSIFWARLSATDQGDLYWSPYKFTNDLVKHSTRSRQPQSWWEVFHTEIKPRPHLKYGQVSYWHGSTWKSTKRPTDGYTKWRRQSRTRNRSTPSVSRSSGRQWRVSIDSSKKRSALHHNAPDHPHIVLLFQCKWSTFFHLYTGIVRIFFIGTPSLYLFFIYSYVLNDS